MPIIRMTCPHCRKRLKTAEPVELGDKFRCASCQQAFFIEREHLGQMAPELDLVQPPPSRPSPAPKKARVQVAPELERVLPLVEVPVPIPSPAPSPPPLPPIPAAVPALDTIPVISETVADPQPAAPPPVQVPLRMPRPGQLVDLVQEAQAFLDEGKIADALVTAERATEKYPANADAWAVLAQAKLDWGDVEEAIGGFKRALRLCSNEADYYWGLGSALEAGDRLADALLQFQRAAQIEPGSTMYRAGVGWLLLKNDRTAEGMPILEQCCREEPDNPVSQEWLAIAYYESATAGWTAIGKDHPLLPEGQYPTEYKHVADAQAFVDKALALKFDKPELRQALHEREELIERCSQRTFTCNWGVAIIIALLGLFGMSFAKKDPGAVVLWVFVLILAILYMISSYAPRYKINEQLVRGKVFKDFAFLASLAEAFKPTQGKGEVENFLIVMLGFFIGTMLLLSMLPFVVGLNFYRNWISG